MSMRELPKELWGEVIRYACQTALENRTRRDEQFKKHWQHLVQMMLVSTEWHELVLSKIEWIKCDFGEFVMPFWYANRFVLPNSKVNTSLTTLWIGSFEKYFHCTYEDPDEDDQEESAELIDKLPSSCPSLTSLSMESSSNFETFTSKLLSMKDQNVKMWNLKRLSVSHPKRWSNDLFERIACLWPDLQVLKLGHSVPHTFAPPDGNGLTNLKGLTYLDIKFNTMEPEVFARICEGLPSLTRLHAQRVAAVHSPTGAKALAKLTSLKALKIDCGLVMRHPSTYELPFFSTLTNLERLDFPDIRHQFEMEDLSRLSNLQKLRVLRLTTYVTSSGLIHLTHLSSLTHLDLSTSIFYTLKARRELSLLTNLKILRLARMQNFKDKHLPYLATLTNLTALTISGQQLFGEGFGHLKPLAANLIDLDLTWNENLNDESVKVIACDVFTNLTRLDIRYVNNITEEGVGQLKASLPKADILWDKDWQT